MRLLNFENLVVKPSNAEDISSFYNDCVAALLEEAKKHDLCEDGIICIPELLSLGREAILAFLNEKKYIDQYGNNPRIYYYVLMNVTINAGIVLAYKWHTDAESLSNYFDNIVKDGPEKEASAIRTEKFSKKLAYKQGHPFFLDIYSRWTAMTTPYWELPDPQPYIFDALVAAYQLGVSMVLNRFAISDKWKINLN